MRTTEKFFQEIIEHPVPLDLNILKSLKRSPLGLDMYLWLTYRMFNLTRPLRLICEGVRRAPERRLSPCPQDCRPECPDSLHSQPRVNGSEAQSMGKSSFR